MTTNTNPNPPRPYTVEELREVNPEIWTAQDNLTIEQSAWEHIQPWWIMAGLDPATYQFPASEEDVIKVLRTLQYDIDRNTILSYVSKSYIHQPPLFAGKRAYVPSAVVQLQQALDQRRCWQDFSSLHDRRKSQLELAMQNARAAGHEYEFKSSERYSPGDLLRWIVQGDDAAARAVLAEALKIKLGEVDWT